MMITLFALGIARCGAQMTMGAMPGNTPTCLGQIRGIIKNSIAKTILAAGLTLMGFNSSVKAQNSTSTNEKAEVELQQRLHPFKQILVSNCEGLPSLLHWGANDIQYVDGRLIIRGIDKLGRNYSIVKGTGLPGCRIWAADLEGSGELDLEVLTPGQDSSGGYDNVLTILLFNSDGQPFPWQAVGKFTASDAGIDQLLVDPRSKNASVIVPTKEGLAGPDANLSFELYRFMPARVVKVSDTFWGLKWPVMYNSTPSLIKHRQDASLTMNLGEDSPVVQLSSDLTSKITGSSVLSLTDGQHIEPPAVLVEDSLDGSRLIKADPLPDDIAHLVQRGAHVRTVGRSCEEEECRPMVLIATP